MVYLAVMTASACSDAPYRQIGPYDFEVRGHDDASFEAASLRACPGGYALDSFIDANHARIYCLNEATWPKVKP